MNLPFETEQIYDAPIQHVWQALTDEESMRVWYLSRLKRFKPVTGFQFEFEDDGSAFQKEWRVTRVVEGRLLAHSWNYRGYPGSSEVTFALFESEDKTRLELTHTGIASFPNDPHFARRRFEHGWANILGNIKELLDKS